MKINDLKDLELIMDIFQETDLVSQEVDNQEKNLPVTEDKEITCKDCGRHFVFSIGEQEFYKSKNFLEPKRCRQCAKKRRLKFLKYK